jgi:hypothetical protein
MNDIGVNSERVDLVNIGLIILSGALALILPFSLFLFAYAILGPLHYLTEINWLKERKFFVNGNSMWLWLVAAAALVMTVPKVAVFLMGGAIGTELTVLEIVNQASNPILLLCIWFAAVQVLINERKNQFIGIALGLIVFSISFFFPSHLLLLGLFVPTLIHVYVFTVLFMLYGALKAQSILGYVSVIMVLIVPFLLVSISVDSSFYSIPEQVKNMFVDSGFHLTNVKFGEVFGVADGTSFFFYGTWELKLQRFVAFAYTYHYLNWFSKTAIIGWHRTLNGKTFWFIIMVWLGLCCLFLIDYRIGFFSALGISYLHVLLELPLNAISVRSLISRLSTYRA